MAHYASVVLLSTHILGLFATAQASNSAPYNLSLLDPRLPAEVNPTAMYSRNIQSSLSLLRGENQLMTQRILHASTNAAAAAAA